MTVTARVKSDGWGLGGRGGNLDVDAEHYPSEGVQVTIQTESGGVTALLTLDETQALRDALSRELAASGREDEPDDETVERVARACDRARYPGDPADAWETCRHQWEREEELVIARAAIAAMRGFGS